MAKSSEPESRDPNKLKNERNKLIAETLVKESDRGCVIMAAAILHDDLEELLRAAFRPTGISSMKDIDPLFHGYGPLATFAVRIQLAYALSLITDEMRSWLNTLRELRNEFAHEWGPIDFADPRCCDKLRQLIAEGKPKNPHEDDTKVIRVGDQLVTKGKMIDRLALTLAVAEMRGRIAFHTQVTREGRALRDIVRIMEEKGEGI